MSKQIGWSNESNLLYEISSKLGRLIGITASIPPPAASGIQSVVAGTDITVDNTDPLNPIVNADSKTYIETIAIAASVWNINHALNTLTPGVEIWNDLNIKIEASSVEVIDANNIQITFGSAITGRVSVRI